MNEVYAYLVRNMNPLAQLQKDVEALKLHIDEHSPSPKRSSDDQNLKLDDYTGLGSAEDYLEWEQQVDKIADYKSLDDQQTFKVAYIRHTKNAGLWFKGVRACRKRAEKPKINTWTHLKKKMRDKNIPVDFDRHNYIKLTGLLQGTMTVNAYIAEFERLTLLCDLEEKEHMKITRFLKGLNRSIERDLDLAQYESFNDLCKWALKAERRSKENTRPSFTPFHPTPPPAAP